MYDILGLFHVTCGILSLFLGAIIFLTIKGTRAHVRVGWAYVGSMLCLNGSALAIYHLTGRFNLFHVLAIFSLVTLIIGLLQALNRRGWRKWLWRHYQYMVWSYVGLLAATCNEAFVRVPVLRDLTTATGAWLPLLAMSGLVSISAAVIFALQGRTLRRYQNV
jgi:uncharacterized membrane protein